MHNDVVHMRNTSLSSIAPSTLQESQPNSSFELPSATASGRPIPRDTVSDWEIGPEDLQICRERDGRHFELGVGAFGKVAFRALTDSMLAANQCALPLSHSAGYLACRHRTPRLLIQHAEN